MFHGSHEDTARDSLVSNAGLLGCSMWGSALGLVPLILEVRGVQDRY